MAKGNRILVHGEGEYRGRILNGIISGTPKPGQVVEIKRGTALTENGHATWEPYGTTAAATNQGIAASGNRSLIAVLLPDENQGKTATDAYVSGTLCRLYIPANGDELNMLYKNEAGTGDDVLVGDRLMIDDGTGKVSLVGGSEESAPFQSLEALTDPTADALIHCIYTGH